MTIHSGRGAFVGRTARLRTIAAMFAPALVWSICALPAAAAPLAIPGQVNLGGPQVTIGTLSAAVTNAGVQSATFTLNPQFLNLMSDVNNDEFRFFQVITYDSNPTKWNGNIITPANTPINTGDVVDTPSGGWDYESTTGNKGGDDTSPFYESDTVNNPTTGKPYYDNPGNDYPSLHSVANGTMTTSDMPSVPPAGSTQFATFIAYLTPADRAAGTVDILGGYTWGVQAGPITAIGPTYIPDSAITGAMLNQFASALLVSGFDPAVGTNWGVTASDAILTTLAPEPSSLALLALAALFGGAWGLKRRGFRRRGGGAVRL